MGYYKKLLLKQQFKDLSPYDNRNYDQPDLDKPGRSMVDEYHRKHNDEKEVH